MKLSKTDAKEIVKEISTLLNKKLNIMDSKGIIIASSNDKRVNTFHEGAYKIINEKLPELEIHEKDLDLKGTYVGLNFPIRINDEIIGVVGITGNSKETRAFGKIVKKMTEILIEGKAREDEKRNKAKVRNYFLVDWILSSNTVFNNQFIQRGLDLNIDIQKNRRVICLEPLLENKENLLTLEKRIFSKSLSFFPTPIVFKESNYIIIVSQLVNTAKLEIQLKNLIEMCLKNNAQVFIGISNEVADYFNIHQNYLEAKQAMDIQRRKNKSGFYYYSDLNIDLIYDGIPIKTKQLFFSKIWHNCRDEDLIKYINILKAYYKTNCSIKNASLLLNIHANTLQYHLTKIKNAIGFDPRNVKDSMLLQLSIDFYNQLKS